MNLFDLTQMTRPDPSLLFRRNDANDVRLGEVVRVNESDYAHAQVVIIGCPQDEGVRRNGGRLGASRAPAAIRRWLYRLSVNRISPLVIFDIGDSVIQPTLEQTHAQHQRNVEQLLRDGKRVIALGGGNDVSYPDCAALANVFSPVTAINVDTHFDVRADTICNSGTPYRQLLAGGHIAPQNFYEIGWHAFANSPIYEKYLRDAGAHLIPAQEISRWQPHSAIQNPNSKIFWGFDLDVVCAADAPGVSAPNPIGIRGSELCRLAAHAGADARTRVVEFSEVNPEFDIDGRTARLAALAIWHVLAGFAVQ